MVFTKAPTADVAEIAASPDELAGMLWWAGLTEVSRAEWLARAGTKSPSAAWWHYKALWRDGGTG